MCDNTEINIEINARVSKKIFKIVNGSNFNTTLNKKSEYKIYFIEQVQKCNQNCNSKNKVKQRYFTTIFKSKVNEKLWRRRNIQSKNHVWVQLHVIQTNP